MIPSELKPVLIKAIAFNPEDRYSWMEDFTGDVSQAAQQLKLDLNRSNFSDYLNKHLHREMIMDSRRVRKLLTFRPPERELTSVREMEEATTVISVESLSIRRLLDTALSGEEPQSDSIESNDLVLETVTFPPGKRST